MFKFFKNVAFYLLIVVAAIWAMDHYSAGNVSKTDISYTAFIKHVQQDEVKSVTISENGITGRLKDGKTFTTVAPNDSTLIPTLRSRDVEIRAELPPQTPWWATLLSTLLPMVLIVGLWFMLMNQSSGGSRMMNFGKSNARRYDESKNKITFKDVAGADEAKQELQEVVEFLKHPQRYNALGAKIPKGVLLYGPPGTGKTLLARAVAGEAGVPFFSISGSDFVEMFVGVGASRVRDLFDQAKKNAPCIVFIDEIDAVGRQRGAGLGGGHDEREQTLNQLLVEMDGFGINEGIIMIAATNRPDILDHALLRPGRFDRQIVVDRPDMRGREAILHVHAKGKPMSPDVDMTTIAKQTTGFTGADLANLVNEAALLTARRNVPMIDMKAMNEAAERVVMGPERRSHLVSDAEKKLTAYHETGHTLVGLLHNDVNVVHKVTIIPRGRAGGYTMSLPKDDRNYQTKSEMLDELQMLLGGRVAEAIVLKDISSGASSDLQRATQLARKMVCQYGMSDRLGSMTFGHPEEEVFLGRDIAREKYSNEVAAVIDEEVHRLMDEAYKGAEKLLRENMDKLVLIAETLLQRETLDGKQLLELMQQGYLTEDGPALQSADQPVAESADIV
ncbi:MAG: ATP-dependent zinc metalloprotease FtsH [Succiniclasticum sp.]|uniref:ATP-dependent zinc metalloprotease FtsH n=1 Tax=Succiniclasticum sp. TaxID=2775030 RepID=UPI000E8D8ACF|nr:ATP-dependent zinc metalloprotease FtsH [Succiniclasticum sp.]MBR1493465.1 ATP-dependent zinc metalloprotease FtsH [Acidaminococcaceae bacterium]MDY6291437.1 ATP-dependent zinc metalloprotease FtsH [Succiniclasticum sp.]HAT98226.1 cell division protein FtsH [Acidaminococcaceae bacterium]